MSDIVASAPNQTHRLHSAQYAAHHRLCLAAFSR
jgi:hypothetical protein